MNKEYIEETITQFKGKTFSSNDQVVDWLIEKLHQAYEQGARNKRGEITYLRIHEDKNGEIDFGISAIEGWEYEKQKEIRSMIITATYVLEDTWRRERDKLTPPNN